MAVLGPEARSRLESRLARHVQPKSRSFETSDTGNFMKTGIFFHLAFRNWAPAVLLVLLSVGTQLQAAVEESLSTLQIGTQVYSNVTVTTKTKAYVFILHSAGMTNVRVVDLPDDVKKKLGYATAEEQAAAKSSGAWAQKTIARLEGPQVKGVEKQLQQVWREKIQQLNLPQPPLTTGFFVIAGAVALLTYLFFCYCSMLICQKTGAQPGILIFLPILQMIPLLRAAGMSPLWLLGMLLPIVNLLVSAVWCFKITQARNKSVWVAVFLLLPLTNLFAFLYLAFSGASQSNAKTSSPRVQVMTLETA